MIFALLPAPVGNRIKEGCQMTRINQVAGLLRDQDRGQGTVEYFLVILAASALAILALNLVNSDTGGGLLGDLFGSVISWVVGRF